MLDHVVNGCSVRCGLSFKFFDVVFYIKEDCCAPPLSVFVVTIYSPCFSSSNAFCCFLDRLVCLYVRLVLSSSSTSFFVGSVKVSMFIRNLLFIGWFFKNVYFLFFNFSTVSKMDFYFEQSEDFCSEVYIHLL